MAGTVGFEPTITGPEPVALPLGYVPITTDLIYQVWYNKKVLVYNIVE